MKTIVIVALALGACATTEKEPSMKMQAHIAGEGRALALVGGGLTGWLSWEPMQARLASSRRVARIQPLAVQLGLENRRLPDGYSIDMEADALAATLAEMSPEPIDLVAWSYGAAIALDFALDHPERIRTLTLIEPPALWVLGETGTLDAEAARASEELRALYGAMTEDVSEEQLAGFVRHAGLVPPGKRPEELPPWASWVKHRRSLRTGGAAWEHRDHAERLRAFDRPVLLVTGRGTAHFLRRIIDGLAATLPQARVLELNGGHAPQIVEPDRFVEELTAFVSR
jgi:pimeloyl-ACP methyl ester carboxylesterase